jgi:hypothetical protein
MRVSGWKKNAKSEDDTDCTFGLNLGKPNREEHFEGLADASVDFDGAVHVFSLNRASFWTYCPELRDDETNPRGTPIRDWLEQRGWLRWHKGEPPHFVLEPVGRGRFRLESTHS